MTVTRDSLLSSEPILQKEAVPVPELGGVIWIREMSGAERDAYEVASSSDREHLTENMRAKLIVRCACDENGMLLFQPGDAEELGKRSSVALDRLANVADRINVLSEKQMRAAMGKSEPTPGDAPSSLSP